MARCSTLIPDRVRCVSKKGSAVHKVLIDNEEVGTVRRCWPRGPWVWTERPDLVCDLREEAVDMLVQFKLKQWKEGNQTAPELNIDDANISKDLRQKVEARDKGLCQYCLMKGYIAPGVECDHFIPRAYGGGSSFDNLQLSCKECNRAKWNGHPKDYFGAEWEQWAPGGRRRWDRLPNTES